jgi:hypothetical protein
VRHGARSSACAHAVSEHSRTSSEREQSPRGRAGHSVALPGRDADESIAPVRCGRRTTRLTGSVGVAPVPRVAAGADGGGARHRDDRHGRSKRHWQRQRVNGRHGRGGRRPPGPTGSRRPPWQRRVAGQPPEAAADQRNLSLGSVTERQEVNVSRRCPLSFVTRTFRCGLRTGNPLGAFGGHASAVSHRG